MYTEKELREAIISFDATLDVDSFTKDEEDIFYRILTLRELFIVVIKGKLYSHTRRLNKKLKEYIELLTEEANSNISPSMFDNNIILECTLGILLNDLIKKDRKWVENYINRYRPLPPINIIGMIESNLYTQFLYYQLNEEIRKYLDLPPLEIFNPMNIICDFNKSNGINFSPLHPFYSKKG